MVKVALVVKVLAVLVAKVDTHPKVLVILAIFSVISLAQHLAEAEVV